MNSRQDGLDLRHTLGQAGLRHYENILTENGFDDWDTVTAITESDMAELGFSLGDRRKLQQAISKTTTPGAVVPPPFREISPASERVKRRYRKRPHADRNAPIRPKTAYVQFGEHLRNYPSLKKLSFTELAKETGRRWQQFSPSERCELWEQPASEQLQVYKAALEAYEETAEYQEHKAYLVKFYARYRQAQASCANSDTNDTETTDQTLTPNDEPGRTFKSELAEPELYDFNVPQESNLPPLQAGMEEVECIFEALRVGARFSCVKPFPVEAHTSAAVQTFLSNTGSLLYLWNNDEAEQLLKAVYHSEHGPAQTEVVELLAMAAIGSYCDGETSSATSQSSIVDAFICSLHTRSHIHPLRAMRLFTCLAICRSTNHTVSARTLIWSALRIGREAFSSPTLHKDIDETKVHYWWSVFRSILFLESWFAYNTGLCSRVDEEDLSLYKQAEQAGPQADTIPERVCDLGRLVAYISLDSRDPNQSRLRQAQNFMNTLNQWHRTLPVSMQPNLFSSADPLSESGQPSRALLQLHILFLGLFTVPFRSCLVDIGGVRLGEKITMPADLETMAYVEKQSVLAARQSARILSLLQINQPVRSHCWFTVYTSFTSCAILLYSATQNLLTLHATEASHDLLYASSHLNMLSLFSCESSAARELCAAMQIVFNDIRDVLVSHSYSEMPLLAVNTTLGGISSYLGVESQERFQETSGHVRDLASRTLDILQRRVNS